MLNDTLGYTTEEKEIDLWLNEDDGDCGWKPLSNREIIAKVTGVHILDNENNSDIEDNMNISDEEPSLLLFAEVVVKSADVLYC